MDTTQLPHHSLDERIDGPGIAHVDPLGYDLHLELLQLFLRLGRIVGDRATG